MTDVAKIAASLSEAQRRAIMELQPNGRLGCRRGEAAARLAAMKPIEHFFERYWGGDAHRYRLTPEGIAVKREIDSQTARPPRSAAPSFRQVLPAGGMNDNTSGPSPDASHLRDLLQAERKPTGKP